MNFLNTTKATKISDQQRSVIRAMEIVLPIALFAVMTGASSLVRLPVPGTPVPITLQSAVVLMSGLFLGPWKGAVSQALYIGLGALGLPFFAAPAALAGPTGGYILGFVLAAFLTGSLSQKIKDHSGVWNKIKTYGLVLIASLGIFVPGVLWLKLLTGQSWSASLAMGFVPFIIGDLIKTAIAVSSYSVAAAAARAAGRIRKNTVF